MKRWLLSVAALATLAQAAQAADKLVILSPHRKSPGSDAEWNLLLREYPQLIRRPVVVSEDGNVTQGFSDTLFKQRFGDRK